MRIGHIADLHLGFRQYDRATKHGINVREMDTAQSFRRVIDDMIAAKVDVVLIAGDLFHTVRPTNQAILEARRQVTRLRLALPHTNICIIAGNHDSPRSVETGSIMPIFEDLKGVTVAWQSVEQLRLRCDSFGALDRDTTVTMVPHLALLERELFAPDPNCRNILLLHGATVGLHYGSGGVEYDASVGAEDSPWDYVALGDYHVCHQVGPRAWYPGSTEWVSSNPWSEMKERAEKGWLLADVGWQSGLTVQFMPVQTRQHVDLPTLHATTAQQLNDTLHNLDALDLENKVVRLVVTGLPRSERQAVDYARVRELRASALHFNLDLRPGATVVPLGAAAGRGEAITLDAIVDRALESSFEGLGAGESAALRALAAGYMKETEPETVDV